jgi:hypothetical protein
MGTVPEGLGAWRWGLFTVPPIGWNGEIPLLRTRWERCIPSQARADGVGWGRVWRLHGWESENPQLGGPPPDVETTRHRIRNPVPL